MYVGFCPPPGVSASNLNGADGPCPRRGEICGHGACSGLQNRQVKVKFGLDLAKKVFQIQGIDVDGALCVQRKLHRAEVMTFFADLTPCLVGIEACAASCFWAREIVRLGQEVSIILLG